MGWESPSHWVIIAVMLVALFGYKRLPEISRSVGRSLRIFKTEIKGMSQDDEARDSAESVTPGTQLPAATPPATTPPAVASPTVAPPAVAHTATTTPPAVAPGVTPVVPAAEQSPEQRAQA
jgi:sec-independent protein translocase protein TatA